MHKSTDSKLQWEDIRYFLALTRESSLSGAARALGVEHSTVARRVDSLEQALGLRLFDRLPRGWQLTTEGEDMVDVAQRMEDEVFAFERAALGAGAVRGTVRVSVPPSFACGFLVPRLAAVRERWSGITLELVGESRDVNLSRREADLALRMGRPSEPGLVVRSVGRVGFGLYARVGYTARAEDEWEFMGLDENLRHLEQQKWLEQFAGKRPFVLRSNVQMGLHVAARAGLGLACLPHYEARQDAELAQVPTPIPAPSRELWLVLHADVRRSPRVRAMADVIADVCTEAADIFAG